MSYDSVVLADSPASYWTLSDPTGTSAVDSADSNSGTYTAGFTLGGVMPPTRGLDGFTTFNGSTGYVVVTVASNIQFAGDCSLELWFKTSSGIAQVPLSRWLSISPFSGYGLAINDDSGHTGQFAAYFGGAWVRSGTNNADGAWHHGVATLDFAGSTVRLYVDGALVTTATSYAKALTSSNNLNIARSVQTGSQFFNGSISSVAVYPSTLTAAQVTAHYNAATSFVAYAGRAQRPYRPVLQRKWARGLARAQTFMTSGANLFPDPASGVTYGVVGTVAWTQNQYGPCMNPNDSTGQGCLNMTTPIAAGANEFTLSTLASTNTLTGGGSGLRHLWAAEGTPTDFRLAMQSGVLFMQVGADAAFTNLTIDPPPLNTLVLITVRLTTAGVRSIWYGPIKVAERTDASCVWGSNGNALGLGSSTTISTRNWSGQINCGYVWTMALQDSEITALASYLYSPVDPPRGQLTGFAGAATASQLFGAALLPAM